MCVRHSSHYVDQVDEGGGQMGKEKLWLVRERAHNLSYISIEDFFHKKKKKKTEKILKMKSRKLSDQNKNLLLCPNALNFHLSLSTCLFTLPP
jgi:hypothetical protein